MHVFIALSIIMAAEPTIDIPKEWHGTYSGTLTINALKNPKATVPVTLEIAPSKDGQSLTWKTSYGGERPMVKDYNLRTNKDGHLILDEGGGVELLMTRSGATIVSTFEVGGMMLTSRYELTKNAKGEKVIKEEIQSFGKPIEKRGVKSFPLIGLQTLEFTAK